MKHPGITIFLLFFGISLLDALWGGHWLRAAFWLAVGIAFAAMDHVRRGRTDQSHNPTARPHRQE